MYRPDSWKIIQIKSGKKTFYKLICGWRGSYLTGSSWRMNSGISKIKYNKKYETYEVHGFSGSIYEVRKDSERVSMDFAGVYEKLLKNKNVKPVSMNKVYKKLNR